MPLGRPRADYMLSGFAWLELTGDIAPVLAVTGIGEPDPGEAVMLYTLTDSTTGNVVASGNVPLLTIEEAGFGLFTAQLTPTTALAVGRTYVEDWIIDGSELYFWRRDAYATAWPMRFPLVTDTLIRATLPILAKYPAGVTAWDAALELAHYTLCQRVVRMARADLLTPSRLTEPALALSLAIALESLGVFPERAAEYRDRFERQMEALRVEFDADGDGDTDATVAQMTSGMGPAATQPRV